MGERIGPSCDHECAVHHPVRGAEIVGALLPYDQVYKNLSPEARRIHDELLESVREFRRNQKRSRK